MKKKTPPNVQKAIPVVKADNRNLAAPGPDLRNRLALLVACFAFLLYAQTIFFDYALDDQAAISENALVHKGFKAIPELLVTDFWHGNNLGVKIPIYRPGSLILFAAEWQFFPDSPSVFHFMNVLLYAIACGLLFLLLAQCFHGRKFFLAFACSLLFAAHPIHTEVVSNIKSADEILCFLFALLSVFCVLKFSQSKSWFQLFFACLFYFFALLCKESAIGFLIAAPLIIYFFTPSGNKIIFPVFGAMLLITGMYLFLRNRVLQSIPEYEHSALVNVLYSTPDLLSRKATAFFVLLRYFWFLVFPHPLSYTYDFAQVKIHSITDVAVLLSILICLALAIVAVRGFRKRSVLSFAILFYFVLLAPVSNIFLTIGSIQADRFLFIPSLGFCLAISWIIFRLLKTTDATGELKPARLFASHQKIFIPVLLITLFYSVKTISRSMDWKNNSTLFGHDVQAAPESASAHFHWANTLSSTIVEKENDNLAKDRILQKAIDEYHTAVAIFPDYMDVYKHLGDAYAKRGYFKNAIYNFEIFNDYVKSTNNEVLRYLANLYDKTGQYDKAILSYKTLLMMQQDNAASTYYYIGLLNNKKQLYDQALIYLDSATRMDPAYILAFKNKALAYLNLGRNREAIETCDAILKLDSGYAKAYCYKGFALSNNKDYTQAIVNLEKGMKLDPGDNECKSRLQVLYQVTARK